ncbi:hypothetical protein EVAR_45420_1 [Eumeta japonica]|uniref:Uncharacterized protein n=1 Tax=Eumeta variegata TaxID=151549 RepID=A0A4C1ZKJ8_EUMVA|nr:hypothetical protein EVAR_45420_1 [Eumeta japonica]
MTTVLSYQSSRTGPLSVPENMVQNLRTHVNQLVDQSNARNQAINQVYTQEDIARSAAADYSSRGVNSAYHTDMEEKPLSPPHETVSYLGIDTDQDAVFGHEMLKDGPPVETLNGVHQAEQNSGGRTMIAQTSSRSALEQKMLNPFATIFTLLHYE